MKQNIHMLNEGQLMQQEKFKEQYEWFNLTRVEAPENRKLVKTLDQELFQSNASFPPLSREMIMLTYNKILF